MTACIGRTIPLAAIMHELVWCIWVRVTVRAGNGRGRCPDIDIRGIPRIVVEPNLAILGNTTDTDGPIVLRRIDNPVNDLPARSHYDYAFLIGMIDGRAQWRSSERSAEAYRNNFTTVFRHRVLKSLCHSVATTLIQHSSVSYTVGDQGHSGCDTRICPRLVSANYTCSSGPVPRLRLYLTLILSWSIIHGIEWQFLRLFQIQPVFKKNRKALTILPGTKCRMSAHTSVDVAYFNTAPIHTVILRAPGKCFIGRSSLYYF